MATPSQSAVAAVDSFAIARELLLEGAGLELAALDRALSTAMVRKLDYVDLYLQLTRYETWTVEDGIVKEGAYSVDQGIGVRAISGERTGFAYSDQLDEAALTDAVVAARGIARTQGAGSQKVAARAASHRPLYPSGDPLRSMSDSDKVALLADLDRRVRAMDNRVAQVIGSLAGVYEVVLVQATDGTLAADVRPLVRLNVSVIMEKDGRREQGYAGGGGRGDYTLLTANGRPLEIAAEAVRTAAVNMSAVPSPAGNMPVVLGSGWPGILLHEAIGHGLEGDFNRKGTSAFTGRIGERVATEQCTVVDDGTLVGRRGSLTVDDEGTPTQLQHADRARRLEGLHVRQDERAAHEREVDRQRPARVVRAHADAAHDEHLHAARRSTIPRRSSRRSTKASTRRTSAAARSTSRAASSCSPRARRTSSRTARRRCP